MTQMTQIWIRNRKKEKEISPLRIRVIWVICG
jgi:hypothetical protein